MPRLLNKFAVLGVLMVTSGCTLSKSVGEKPTIRWRIGETIVNSIFGIKDEEVKRTGWDPDPSWRQGYGFNNPNPDRIRNGQPVLNFDGSVYEP